jgi:cell volume regulation protein A
VAAAPTPALLTVLFVGGALLVGYAAHVAFRRLGVSDVLFLLLAGLLVGPVLGLVSPSVIAPAIPVLSPIALVIVLFEGGLELKWLDLRAHAGRALSMGVTTWALTALAVAVAAHVAFGYGAVLAALFGLCVAATGMLVVIPLLAHLDVAPDARVLLTVETSLGDLLSVVAVTTLSGVLVLGSSPWSGAVLLGDKFVIGASVGLLAGIVWGRSLHKLPVETHGYPLTLGAVLLAYGATEMLGGSGYICALLFGLFLGNAASLVRLGGLRDLRPLPPSMRTHQGEIIFLLRSVYFVFLGLTVPRSVLTPAFLAAGLLLLLAIVAARVVGVALTTRRGFAGSRGVLVSMMPRGLATAVIAGIPAAMGVPGAGGFLAQTFLVIVLCDLATSAGLYLVKRRTRVPQDSKHPTPGAVR